MLPSSSPLHGSFLPLVYLLSYSPLRSVRLYQNVPSTLACEISVPARKLARLLRSERRRIFPPLASPRLLS